MVTAARTQRIYDHRLRNLVYSTGRIEIALDRGVPRSTARGWLRTSPRQVVSIDELEQHPNQMRFGMSTQPSFDFSMELEPTFTVSSTTSHGVSSPGKHLRLSIQRLLLRSCSPPRTVSARKSQTYSLMVGSRTLPVPSMNSSIPAFSNGFSPKLKSPLPTH